LLGLHLAIFAAIHPAVLFQYINCNTLWEVIRLSHQQIEETQLYKKMLIAVSSRHAGDFLNAVPAQLSSLALTRRHSLRIAVRLRLVSNICSSHVCRAALRLVRARVLYRMRATYRPNQPYPTIQNFLPPPLRNAGSMGEIVLHT